MAAVNKVILVGHLGRDPEVRYTPDGRAICNFTMATTDTWKDKNSGEKRERTEWHRIVAWRKLGELCGEYLSKGRQVYIEGRLQTRDWEDKDGNKRYTTEIIASRLNFLGSRADQASEARVSASSPEGSPQTAPKGEDLSDEDEDLPF